MPRITSAAAATLRGTSIVSDDPTSLRRWRSTGGSAIPADSPTLEACLARGHSLSAVGPAMQHVEHLAFTLHERPLVVPMASVLTDLRRDQLVAVALSDAALPYLGPVGMASFGRLGVDRGRIAVTTSLAALVRTDIGGQVQVDRHSASVDAQIGAEIGGRQLVTPISVAASGDGVAIGTPPFALVSGKAAALAVFDRTEEVVLRSAAGVSPGLPVSLGTMPAWSHATIAPGPACVGGSQPWLQVTGAARVSASMAGASPGRPLVAYVATAERPRPRVSGLPLQPASNETMIEIADPSDVAARGRLAEQARLDGVDLAARRPGMFWTRVVVGPRDPWHEPRATLAAGTVGDWWIAPPGARGASTRSACRLTASGDRLLLGQYGAVDDDSTREIEVWAFPGWHVPERVARGVVQQWSAQAEASVGFWLAHPVDLVLALDAAPGRGTLRLSVNGAELHHGWSGAGRLDIPAGLLRTGENVLTLSVPDVVRPPRDPRSLGVLVRQLRLITAR
jgi:hypothetical protein